MKGALVIFVAMVVIGVVLYLIDVFYYRRKKGLPAPGEEREAAGAAQPDADSAGEETPTGEGEVCCGMHTVCEKTNLSPVTGEIVYYDDEELDRFRGREATDYSPEEVEEFRDVLMTLLPQDVAGWSRSIQVRGINLPVDVRDELLMIVADLRRNG